MDYIKSIEKSIQQSFMNNEGSHDWYHIERVLKLATHIQQYEGGQLEVIQLLALTHDISDHKLNGGQLNAGKEAGYTFLISHDVPPSLAEKVADLIDEISFKGNQVNDQCSCIESRIVQDADRLDAIGAIGIARAFSYGGSKHRPLYAPEVFPESHTTFESYVNSGSHTINHFYEKLFLLQDRLHTPTAKNIGAKRHKYMVEFVEQFKNEWHGITY